MYMCIVVYTIPFCFYCIYYHADEESGFGVLSCIALAAQRNLTVNFDMSRIEQVIRNLITNAVRRYERTYI